MPVLPSDAKEIVTSSTECLDLLSWMLQIVSLSRLRTPVLIWPTLWSCPEDSHYYPALRILIMYAVYRPFCVRALTLEHSFCILERVLKKAPFPPVLVHYSDDMRGFWQRRLMWPPCPWWSFWGPPVWLALAKDFRSPGVLSRRLITSCSASSIRGKSANPWSEHIEHQKMAMIHDDNDGQNTGSYHVASSVHVWGFTVLTDFN